MLRVYVDLDDVLSQTARAFTEVLVEMFGKRVRFEEITRFDLSKSFGLDAAELEAFMHEAHRPERLIELAPMEDAVDVLEQWRAHGFEIDVLTGRPPASAEVSHAWLERHGVPYGELFFVDKYTRYDESAWEDHGRVLRLEELHGDRYDLVVEDSLKTASYLAETTSARVLLLDKPWNRDVTALPQATLNRIERHQDWLEVDRAALDPRARLPSSSARSRRR